jgi:hypothetical protein
MKTVQIARKLIGVEVKGGFLYVPSHGVAYFPSHGQKITVATEGVSRQLTYNAEHRRIFGLTSWYKSHHSSAGDEVVLNVSGKHTFTLQYGDKSALLAQAPDATAHGLVDLSGLSSQAKGDIVEDRVKELLLLHGQGLLSVFKPVTDTEGIDLIVTKAGEFHPIFLQVKGRYTLHQKRSIIVTVNAKTFTPHQAFYVVAAYFDPVKLEIHDDLLMIPSQDFKDGAAKVKKYDRYQIVSPLGRNSHSKWTKYLVSKSQLANKLIEHFEAMNRFYR